MRWGQRRAICFLVSGRKGAADEAHLSDPMPHRRRTLVVPPAGTTRRRTRLGLLGQRREGRRRTVHLRDEAGWMVACKLARRWGNGEVDGEQRARL